VCLGPRVLSIERGSYTEVHLRGLPGCNYRNSFRTDVPAMSISKEKLETALDKDAEKQFAMAVNKIGRLESVSNNMGTRKLVEGSFECG